METVEKKSIAGQQTAIQTDFSTRNALARIIRCLFAEKLLDDNNCKFSMMKITLSTRFLMGYISFNLIKRPFFLQIPLLIAVILSLNQWMAATEWCNLMKNSWGY